MRLVRTNIKDYLHEQKVKIILYLIGNWEGGGGGYVWVNIV
jgi:hypothetical protein